MLATAEKEPPVVAAPPKPNPRQARPPRLKPPLEANFERACLKLSAELGYDVDRVDLFNQLVDRAMPAFFDELLKGIRAAAAPKGRGPKGGQEPER